MINCLPHGLHVEGGIRFFLQLIIVKLYVMFKTMFVLILFTHTMLHCDEQNK